MKAKEMESLAAQHGLELEEKTIRINESGVDFQVAHASDRNGEHWILRMPRRKESMRHAVIEKQALEELQKVVSFQLPQWAVFSDELIAYKKLAGAPAATIDAELQAYVWKLDEQNVPADFYVSLGQVLAELHDSPQKRFLEIGVETLSAEELRSSMKRRIEWVKGRYHVNPQLLARWEKWLQNESIWPNYVGVRHGDLHPGHIMIDDAGQVTGLIDWTEVSIGDVSIDFLSHYLLFGQEGLERLIEAYRMAGGKVWQGMAEHIIELHSANAITVAEYANVSGLAEMEEAAKQMLAGG
ncbi:MAG TPA: macrolide 2'-phosphotransferase [Planococcus sp. (in: firmicutes)]|nr:macrolide 2'-phosphotransferase [Planococcus sp. (in: firmicutes)]